MNHNTLTHIKTALISVYYKDGLEPLVKHLHSRGVRILSTGGTRTFISELGIPVEAVEDLTGFAPILDGRVKTLHPVVFGGILSRPNHAGDAAQLAENHIPEIDLVIVDLYPFEETVGAGGTESEIIEKIDIGGISLIRAAAKNHARTVILSSKTQYARLLGQLETQDGAVTFEQRHAYAKDAFGVTSAYDRAIGSWFSGAGDLALNFGPRMELRYGENPHQPGNFYGDFDAFFEKIQGKELSYNNLLDVDAAVGLMEEFKSGMPAFAILKHNNACGLAEDATLKGAFEAALAADPVSAFGGILIANRAIDRATAEAIGDLFFEVLIAPGFEADAPEVLGIKKNRILLKRKETGQLPSKVYRSALNGILEQEADRSIESRSEFRLATNRAASEEELRDLEFALKPVKHTKSNTIVLAKDGRLLASGTGQTSRVDALRQAIDKSRAFGFDLRGAVMASDAFFPFPDCVEIAKEAGITAVVQPGGSVKDQLSIDYCNANGMAMYMTGVRHFKH
jgi:phosphoribosylaminoimidazolecarboxamide formyltransferase / IMP cyclohydrolase